MSGTPQIIDQGTNACIATPLLGIVCGFSQAQANDEITPIARYMAAEMNRNALGQDAKRMAEMNGFSADQCIADFTRLPWWQQLLGMGIKPEDCVNMEMSSRIAALMLWAGKVRQNGDWDHKPIISRLFHPRVPNGRQFWHHYRGQEYYYDVWSNLHYGYVGAATGFSKSVLLDGAGLEQIGATLLRGKIPERSPGVSGLRAWDGLHDRAAISMGVSLYRNKPNAVIAQDLLSFVCSGNVEKRPFSQ